jgi:protein-S-isoprenylcysteine O-methyltransferase Ste14
MSLRSKLILRFFLGLMVVAAMLFIPAGSWNFWQAWAYLALVFFPMLLASCYFYKHDPQLIERRLQMKEKVREQKLIMKLANVIFIAAFLFPGLDHRLGWSRASLGQVPLWLTILAQALALGGYLVTLWVMKVNSFASRIIEVAAGQKVISSGPYRIVCHPMYFGGIVMWLFTPLALGSYWALPAFALFIPIIVFRLLNEEKILRQELPGYPEYCLRTRFRLIPFVW